MDKIEFRCPEMRRKFCRGKEHVDSFAQHMKTVDEVNECFLGKINNLKTEMEQTIINGRNCYKELQVQKCRFKKFHENTIDYLKRFSHNSDDIEVIANCEHDICVMHRMFVKEVIFINKCEEELKPFFQKLNTCEDNILCDCCCLHDYSWLPVRE